MNQAWDIVILGLSITSSWGNGHATTYRSLVQGLAQRGRRILFLERDVPWYANHRDETAPAGAVTRLYESVDDLVARFKSDVSKAKLVVIGSYVPDGIEVGEWVISTARGKTAFYDIDTPITLAALRNGDCEYLNCSLITRYDAYFSFTGGPVLRRIENEYGSKMARPLYCSVDSRKYQPQMAAKNWDMGYLGTYSADRQPGLTSLLLEPASRSQGQQFVIAGPQYPSEIRWPLNVERVEHLSPAQHALFYSGQRFTLNITRHAMREAGYSPSVRLFEAAACGAPIISDWWNGLDSVFEPNREILIAETGDDVCRFLSDLPEATRMRMAEQARQRILREHTSEARAEQLEQYWMEMNDNVSPDQTWEHRRSGQNPSRMAARVESEFGGPGTSQPSDSTFSPTAVDSDLHEPAGTSY